MDTIEAILGWIDLMAHLEGLREAIIRAENLGIEVKVDYRGRGYLEVRHNGFRGGYELLDEPLYG